MAHSVADTLRGGPGPEVARIGDLIGRLQDHPIWRQLSSLERVRCFMEHHVWAVWDFMSLLKSLQTELAPARIPWVPPRDCAAARFINEIVVGEESDEGPDGRPASHFEIYIRAIEGAGARTQPILSFVADVACGDLTHAVFERTSLPSPVRRFVQATLSFCRASLPERVAAFTMGREEIIPAMFTAALRGLPEREHLEGFIWYLDRHVAIDRDRHGPLGARLFEKVCLSDATTRGKALLRGWRLKNVWRLWNAVTDEVRRLR
jgi:Protein of unknown function (DUF3050)